MKAKTKIPALIVATTLGFLAVAPASAAIYTVTFDPASGTSISTYNWTAYQDNGTNRTNSTTDPFRVVATSPAGFVFMASGSSNLNQRFALISNASTINLADYQNDLTISFSHQDTDDGTQQPDTMGYRVLVTVGSTIYASDFFSRHTGSTPVTRDVVVADAVWREWTGETDLTDGFDIADISGTAGTISGNISNIGILAIDGPNSNDRMRLYDFTISGTLIPEPSAALLGGLGMLFLLRRRR